MKRLADTFRFIVVSPEMLMVLIPFGIHVYVPAIADVLVKPMRDGIGFGLGAVGLSLAMLAFNYREGFELLSPSGRRRVLLEWPDYPMLKSRVIAALTWCTCGVLGGVVAVWMVATDFEPRLAIAILVAGILAASASTATIALARFTSREILGE